MPVWTTPAVVRARFQSGAGQVFDHVRRAAAGRRRESDHSAAADGDVDRRVAHRTRGRKRTRQGMISDSASTRGDTPERPCQRSTNTMGTSPVRPPRRRASWRGSIKVERAVLPFRRLLTVEAKATVRFETDGYSGRGGRGRRSPARVGLRQRAGSVECWLSGPGPGLPGGCRAGRTNSYRGRVGTAISPRQIQSGRDDAVRGQAARERYDARG